MKPKVSLNSLSLRRKMWVAVSLVTLLPLIVLLHYLSGVYISLPALAISIFIVFLGWWIIFEVFFSIRRVYNHTKKTLKDIAETSPDITDEVQSIDSVIMFLSSKMKDSLAQLKDFSEKTEALNQEVSKKVFVLSTIIQANELFSKEAPSEDVLQFLVQRLKEILGMRTSFYVSRDENMDRFNVMAYFGIDVSKIEAALAKGHDDLLKIKKIAVFDKENKTPAVVSLVSELGGGNIALSPVMFKGQLAGFLAITNNFDDFVFSMDDLNILNLFSQNISLIWEHKKLSVKVDELEMFDYLTGLYNEKFMVKRLDEEIKRSLVYQRPCGFLLMEISNFDEYQKTAGLLEAEKLVKRAAKLFRENLRPIDIAGRLTANKLGAILIEKNKRQSQTMASTIKEKLEQALKGQIKLQFCVAENPIDGATSLDLIHFADSHMNASK